MSKHYYQPHIQEARDRLQAMVEAIDKGQPIVSVQSSTELKATLNETKTKTVFVRIEIADERTTE